MKKRVCDALSNLGWLETEHALHGEGVRAIRGLLGCSSEDAIAVLRDLRVRKRIDVEMSPGGELDARRPMPVAQLRWIQPATRKQRT